MKKTLRISDDLALPTAYATSRNMVLGQSSSGKSNTCVVLAEAMHEAKIPWIAIDPKGDWYGVRSNRNGKGRGLDVPVFGGEFGDLPLSPLAGSRMAELAAAGKLCGVLDVSDFPKPSDVSRFLTDFATTLLKKQRTPLHLFLEECADYLPQGGYRGQLDPMAAACVGAMKRLATKGRFRGIGYTVISQRAAEVNKTVLYQCETLIAHRLVGDLDVNWIAGWVKRSSARAPELLDTVHDLRDGECWVWSPQRLKIIERIQARRRETFDSGQTPEIGQARVVPKLAKVEIEALRKELADLEEQAKADDPRELKKLVLNLERELKLEREIKHVKATHPVVQKGVALKEFEVVVDRRHLEETIKLSEDFEKEILEFGKTLGQISRVFDSLQRSANVTARAARRARETGPAALAKRLAKAGPAPASAPGPRGSTDAERGDFVKARNQRRPVTHSDSRPVNGSLPKAERQILTTLAQHGPLSLTQAAIIAGYSSKSGGMRNAAGALRTLGYAVGGNDRLEITADGERALGVWDPLPTGAALAKHWYRQLPKAEREILTVVVENYPDSCSLKYAAERCGYAPDSGGVRNAAGKLRTLDLVVGSNGGMMANERLIG